MPRRVLRVLICVGLLSSSASPAFAHSALKSASPGPGDRVSGSPKELVAQFSQNLDPSRTSIEVRDASGTPVARGGELGGSREFRLGLPELAPGIYQVRWTTSSTEDSEIGRGTYTFEVLAAPSLSLTPIAPAGGTARPSASPTSHASPGAPSSSPPTSPEPGSDTSGTSGIDTAVTIPIVVALAVVGVLGFWMLRRTRE